MKRMLILGLALAAALPALALAADAPYFEAYDEAIDTLTIVRIDTPNRVVTLKDAEGDTIAIVCGEEVRNFPQLRVKDLVVMTYKQTFSVRVDTTGAAEATTETVTGRAPLGAKPSASRTEKTEVKATISAIDLEQGTVTLTAMNNEPFTLTPLVRDNLKKVKVGDLVVFTSTLTTAISVEKPAAAKTTHAKKAAPAKQK
jgi:hypothetical protein